MDGLGRVKRVRHIPRQMRTRQRTAGELSAALLGLSKGGSNSESWVPVPWELTGRTGLRNAPRVNRMDYQRLAGGGTTGVYTLRRSWRMAKAKGKAMGRLGRELPCYFITHTMPAELGNDERRRSWRMFLDNLRKHDPLAYVWVTERHDGDGPTKGLIHHHMVVAFRSVWFYSSLVRRWSWKYAGSVNGLDIQRVQRNAAHYVTKYVTKGLGATDATKLATVAGDGQWDGLPFRWWGSSGIPTQGETLVRVRDFPQFGFRVPWYSKDWLWVSESVTATWAAERILAELDPRGSPRWLLN